MNIGKIIVLNENLHFNILNQSRLPEEHVMGRMQIKLTWKTM